MQVIDCNNDGKVDQDDIAMTQQLTKIEIDQRKDKNHVRLA